MPEPIEHTYTAAEWAASGAAVLADESIAQVIVDGLLLKFSQFRSDYELHCMHGEQLYFHFRFRSRVDLVKCAVAVGTRAGVITRPAGKPPRRRGFDDPAFIEMLRSGRLAALKRRIDVPKVLDFTKPREPPSP